MANFLSDDVSILLGDGTGGFEVGPGAAVPVQRGPLSIVSADFDGDGDLDLAVANSVQFEIEGNSVSILLGQGDGSFVVDSNHGIQRGPAAVTTGHFDNDGVADLAVTSAISEEVKILLGTGDGRFETHATIRVGASPSSIVGIEARWRSACEPMST